MRTIAIIGSGIAGLLTAHGLVRAGHKVTLFSDRTADQWRYACRPTGTAARFDPALAYERELGLDHWSAEAPRVQGVHLTFCPEPGNQLLTLTGRVAAPAMAIDVRLQSHRWMNDLVARGGELVIEAVNVARLDAIAAEHDLTVVAAGKAELSALFERDAARSVYDKPQRNLTLVVTKGGRQGFDGVPFLPVKFNLFGSEGEAFWVPSHHREVGPSFNLLFEAKPGSRMDVFEKAKSGHEVLDLPKKVIRDLMPWDHDWAKDMELADENGWLVGKVTPTVRRPVGRLPSGRVVTCVGDTAMLFDPIGGQGANNGTRMAKHLVASVAEHGDRPFDAAWMTDTFERFHAGHGGAAYTFNNILLEPITDAGKELLIAQYGSDGTRDDGRQAVADAFSRNFIEPMSLTPLFNDLPAARAFIARTTGKTWVRSALAGRLGIARAQLRQKLGMSAGHPATAPDATPRVVLG